MHRRKNNKCFDCNKDIDDRAQRCFGCSARYKNKKFGYGFQKGQFSNEKHPFWKGDRVSYYGLHIWVRKHLGQPKECVYCGEDQKLIQWASISHQAKRDLSDYIPLCVSCHIKYDRKQDYSLVYLNFFGKKYGQPKES